MDIPYVIAYFISIGSVVIGGLGINGVKGLENLGKIGAVLIGNFDLLFHLLILQVFGIVFLFVGPMLVELLAGMIFRGIAKNEMNSTLPF